MYPEMTPNQTPSNFNQYNVVAKRGGFVNMTLIKYVWARTFPTVFYPTYYNGQWVISHDITGHHSAREKHITFDRCIYYQMWRGDAMSVKHLPFFLVLYNYKIKSQLQSQGRVVLNISYLNVNISAGDISKILKDAVARNDVACIKKMLQRLHNHYGN